MKLKSFALAEVKAVETDDPSGEFEAILSAPTKDRDGETIKSGAFDPLPDHITIDVDHGLSTGTTVGSGKPFYDGDVLKVRGTFSSIPRAQEVRTLVTEGHIRSMSVAFMGVGTKSPDGVIQKAELLNAAFVAVPSNRDAAVLMVKAAKLGEPPTTKAIAGSYEDRQEALRGALTEFARPAIAAAYPNADPGDYEWRLQIIATFDDTVVYRIGWDGDDAFQVSYAWDGDDVSITGTPEAVTVEQIVTPATDAPVKAAASPAHKAAGATADAAGDEQDDEAMRARALHLVAQATAAAI